jgi:hypothetical protein
MQKWLLVGIDRLNPVRHHLNQIQQHQQQAPWMKKMYVKNKNSIK